MENVEDTSGCQVVLCVHYVKIWLMQHPELKNTSFLLFSESWFSDRSLDKIFLLFSVFVLWVWSAVVPYSRSAIVNQGPRYNSDSNETLALIKGESIH